MGWQRVSVVTRYGNTLQAKAEFRHFKNIRFLQTHCDISGPMLLKQLQTPEEMGFCGSLGNAILAPS
jgi:hypothetical protein